MGRLSHMFSKRPTTSEFLMHRFFPEHPIHLLPFSLPPCSDCKVLEELSISMLLSSLGEANQQGLLLAGAKWQLIPVSIQWFVKMKSFVRSHCVRWSSCCSWQWNRWVPAVPMTSHRSGKSASTQLSLELLLPPPPQRPYSSLLMAGPAQTLLLEPLDTQKKLPYPCF